MATENGILLESYPAGEDLSNDQYRFVVLTSSGTVRRPDSADEIPIGILQNAPASGAAASVMSLGRSKIQAGGALSVGALIGPEYVSASDAGKAVAVDASKCFAVVIESASAEDDLASCLLMPRLAGGKTRMMSVSTVDTAAAATYTAAQLLGGLILRDPNGGSRSDVSPTAAEIVAALPGVEAGSAFEFVIRNTADASETITLTAGTGVTLSGTMTIAQNNSKRFLCVVTAVGTPAVTIYSLGTMVH